MDELEKIKQGAKLFTLIPWPGTEHQVRVRVLFKDELQQAMFKAHGHFQANEIPQDRLHTLEDFGDERTTQILYRALSIAEGDDAGKPLAKSIEAFRRRVTRNELTVLANQYAAWEEEVSPNTDRMSDEEIADFVEDLKKKPDETIGFVSNIAFARRLLRFMAAPPES